MTGTPRNITGKTLQHDRDITGVIARRPSPRFWLTVP
jgi:hypothetical protein